MLNVHILRWNSTLYLVLLFCLIAGIVVLCPGDVAGQFTAALSTCPGDIFTFRCTVNGDVNGFTIWRVDRSSECVLAHRSTSPSASCGQSNAFIARSETGFGTNGPSFSSTLSGTAIPALNGTQVECFGPANNVDLGNRISGSILGILGPPSLLTLSCVKLSGNVSGVVNVTVSWTLSGGDSADFYLINITTNAPQTPYGGLLNITTASVTQHELTGFTTGYEYNITVHGVNCGSQEGRESEPLTIRPQVPAQPFRLNVCGVYDAMNGTLLAIESTWKKVDDVTISEVCAKGLNVRAIYELSYTTDSGIMCVVDGIECSDNTCRYKLQSNTADSRCQRQFSGESVTVSVTARNIVGRSNSAMSGIISGTNTFDLVVRIKTTNLSSALVECTFFQPGYTCTIDYSTDPSYTNPVYRDTSSTKRRRTTITLSQMLRQDATYYYIVSAVSNLQCVRVQGRFRAGCNKADLIDQTGTVKPVRCADRRFVSGSAISDGMVCYNGTTAGSRAVYFCNDGYSLMDGNKDTRVCQSDGNWNGSILQCIQEKPDQIGQIVGGVVGGVVGVAIIGLGAVAVIIMIIKERRCQREEDGFFVMSKLGYNLVMDVTSGNRNPGTQVISYNKISPPKLSQLWMKKQFDDDTFYLVSKLSKRGSSCMIKIQDGNAVIGNSGSRFREERDEECVVLRENDTRNVLGVKESSTDPKTPIVTTSSKIAVDSQKWKYFTPGPPNMDGFFFIRIGTSQVVMDVDAFSTKPGTQVICYIQKDPPADNQLWMKGDVEADNNGFYLVSKLDLSCKITIQDDKAVIGTGSLFMEERDGESVELIVKETNKVLSAKDNYAGTPIMAVSRGGSGGYKRWNLMECNA